MDAEAARQLLAIMDRELAKNPTMTTPYGVTLRTIYKALCEKDAIGALKDSGKCAISLAKLLVECIPEVAVEAGRIMEWLREVAGMIAKQNRGMRKRSVSLRRIARFWSTTRNDRQRIDVRKQVDGIVAHLVHSMDAAHWTNNAMPTPGSLCRIRAKTGDLDIQQVLASSETFGSEKRHRPD